MFSQLVVSLLLIASLSDASTMSPGLRATRNLAGVCPIDEPVEGTSCNNAPDVGCSYDHVVSGCSVEDLKCSPSLIYYCNTSTNLWEKTIIPQLRCFLEGAPFGSCDPETFQHGLCPSTTPTAGTDCSTTGTVECPYNYQVGGCSERDAYCFPSETAVCESNGDAWLWQVAVASPTECTKGQTPEGTCDGATFVPSVEEQEAERVKEPTCPKNEPTNGEACSGPVECPYNYQAIGCSDDDVRCLPGDTFYCGLTQTGYMWQQISIAVQPCPDEYTPPGECKGEVFAPNKKHNIFNRN